MPRKPTKDRDPTEQVTLQIRFREEMRRRLQDAADQSGTSMNAEAVGRLEQSFGEDELFGNPATRALLREIAAQILNAESATGKAWYEDAETYWAARRLAEDVWVRSRPKPQNFEEANEVEALLITLRTRRKVLTDFLQRCGALSYQNALMVWVDGSEDVPLKELERINWRNPKQPDDPPTEEEAEFIKECLAERREVEAEYQDATKRLKQLLEPWHAARHKGQAIYERLTGKTDTQAERGE